MEGVEPTHSHEYQILSLARLPIPPHRPWLNVSSPSAARKSKLRNLKRRPRISLDRKDLSSIRKSGNQALEAVQPKNA